MASLPNKQDIRYWERLRDDAIKYGNFTVALKAQEEIDNLMHQNLVASYNQPITIMPPPSYSSLNISGTSYTTTANSVGTITNNSSSMSYKFREGDRVVLIKIHDKNMIGINDKSCNPIWGEDGNYIAGRVHMVGFDAIEIYWDTKTRNMYYNGSADIVLADKAPKKKTSSWANKSKGIDTLHLDKLVMKDEAKAEILAVLKQHQHQAKLFEEWGLGEVIEYGRGMTFMFYGPPGTGKTWGANCIAKALGTELLVVSAGDIQTSEPGGANRAITEAFKQAKEGGKVLFLDECDSLITVRSEVGMILSSEINTLLTEIEKFEGVAILATNRIGMMDEALERRIALMVEFPEPDYDARMQIWTKMLPKKMPLKGVKIEKLSEHKLTGGQIKNVVLQAARLALADNKTEVDITHFEQAISRVHASKSLMGKGSDLGRAKISSMDKVMSS